MMNLQELRLYSWVYSLEIGEYVQIESIDSECVTFKNHVTFDYVYADMIEPIPLTEEILLKCGFRDEGTHLQLNLSNNWCYEWFDNLIGFSLCKDRRGLCLGKIKYIHGLQNLHHSLTGEELEINL